MNPVRLRDGLRAWVHALSELDPYSLACFRIGIGAVLLYDIGLAWSVLELWPGIQGYFDGLPLPEGLPNGLGMLKLLFGLYALLALGVLLGYQTRCCTLALWIAFTVHRYVSQTTDYHDDVLFHALFWAQFLDWGQRFSLDARLGRATGYADVVSRMASCGLVLNLAYLYVSTAWEKSDPAWWPEGSAVYFALGDVALSGPVGRWIVEQGSSVVFQGLSGLVLALEFVGGLLIASPWARLRLAGLLALMLLQAGLWVCMRLESFPATMLSVQVALLPAFVWTRWGFRASCLIGIRPRWQRNALLALVAGIAVVNAEGLRLNRLDAWSYPGAEALSEVRDFFDLQGVWRMYAPAPPDYTCWWVGVGRNRAGEEVDPITGVRPTFAEPDNSAWPFGALGSVYWYYGPDPEGEVQNEFVRFLLWQDRRYTPPEKQLTHFMLFYVYVPYLPLEDGPHDPIPMLVSRWPVQISDPEPRPPLRKDSVLHGVDLYELDYERWGEMPERAAGPKTY